jgi:NTE family protein
MRSIGLVLSGGGARGIGHLGVLQALDEMSVKIERISGTSAGAIIGAFYAEGFKPNEILDIAKETTLFGFSNFLIGKAGFFDMKTLEGLFHKYMAHNTIEKLKIQLSIAATDIVKGEVRYFSKGNLSMALMASSCVPLVFQPVKFEDTYYLDGGILNNFPIEPLKGHCDKVIGVHVNALSKKIEQIHMKDMLDRSFHFALNKDVIEKSRLCDVFIEPQEMSRFGMFDMSNTQEVFDFVYKYTISKKQEILDACN